MEQRPPLTLRKKGKRVPNYNRVGIDHGADRDRAAKGNADLDCLLAGFVGEKEAEAGRRGNWRNNLEIVNALAHEKGVFVVLNDVVIVAVGKR